MSSKPFPCPGSHETFFSGFGEPFAEILPLTRWRFSASLRSLGLLAEAGDRRADTANSALTYSNIGYETAGGLGKLPRTLPGHPWAAAGFGGVQQNNVGTVSLIFLTGFIRLAGEYPLARENPNLRYRAATARIM